MPTHHSAKNSFFKRIPTPAIGAFLVLPMALAVAGHAATTHGAAHATVAVGKTGPAGSGIDLTVGLTPNGDGSSCGIATSVQVNIGDVVDFCYMVANHSAADLAYSTLVDSADGTLLSFAATAIPADGSYVYHHSVHARTSSVHQVAWTARSDRTFLAKNWGARYG
jgi:hypothetical protein